MAWRAITTIKKTTRKAMLRGRTLSCTLSIYYYEVLGHLMDNILSYKKRSIDKKDLSFLVPIYQGQQDAWDSSTICGRWYLSQEAIAKRILWRSWRSSEFRLTSSEFTLQVVNAYVQVFTYCATIFGQYTRLTKYLCKRPRMKINQQRALFYVLCTICDFGKTHTCRTTILLEWHTCTVMN